MENMNVQLFENLSGPPKIQVRKIRPTAPNEFDTPGIKT